MTCGIYEIKNTINNKRYIGQSINIEKRWQNHKRELKTQKHYNSHLQNSWNKYGESAFVFSIIEKCPKELLDEREQYWININDSYNNGYNLDNGGSGVLKYTEDYYRVIKKGRNRKGAKRYQIVKDAYAKPIVDTIFQNEANKICDMLNNKQITENEAKQYMNAYGKNQPSPSLVQLRNLGLNYLIIQSSKGYTQKDIRRLHNISESSIKKFLKEEQITWKEIFAQGEQLKIQKFDEKNNIQQQLIDGVTNKEIKNKIGCSMESLKKYKKQHNIRKPHVYISNTNTGVQYLTLTSKGEWQYRKTYQNPNNIYRVHFEDIKQVVMDKGYIWIVHDEEKLQKAIKKSKIHREIIKNKKIGKKINKKRKNERHKQKNAKKRALKAFRKMFPAPKQQKKSPTGISRVKFNKPEICWVFDKPNTKGLIKRQKLSDLEKEVKKQNYKWYIEDEKLLNYVKKEVCLYKEERKKPFLERKDIDFKYI